MSLQTVVATDVAELLMQGHEQSALNLPMAGVNDELERHASSSTAPAAHDSDVTSAAAADASSGVNRSYINSMPSQTALDRFRQLCLFGRKKVRRQCAAAVATSFMII